jgi:bifunctional N-acetylglucosamine-1-phosphate-uridyltransferase/glucosamine-1-phosphate-acetyltransferase GlmU-like protein
MLGHLKPNESVGEYYLTDVFSMLKDRGYRVEIIDAVPPEDVLSINTPQQLAEVDAILRARLNMPLPRRTTEVAR